MAIHVLGNDVEIPIMPSEIALPLSGNQQIEVHGTSFLSQEPTQNKAMDP